MIVFERPGDIFESELQSLVCPVNTVGTMGKGLAKAFKERFGGLDWMYQQACRRGLFKAGFVVWSGDAVYKVVCVPTKRHWRNPSKLEWIDHALRQLAAHYHLHGIKSLAMPAIGCGEGQLSWPAVRGLIYEHFAEHPLPVGIYEPLSVK